jgi:hypothetical protein
MALQPVQGQSHMKKPRVPKPALPPPGLRPKLDATQQTDLAITHLAAVDDIVSGRGTFQTLLQYMGGLVTWMFVAEALRRKAETEQHVKWHAAMATAFGSIQAVADRYTRTKKTGFTGQEYQLAKAACEAMDELAAAADLALASAAADRAEVFVNQLVDVINQRINITKE